VFVFTAGVFVFVKRGGMTHLPWGVNKLKSLASSAPLRTDPKQGPARGKSRQLRATAAARSTPPEPEPDVQD
jgi:hypothetical protein